MIPVNLPPFLTPKNVLHIQGRASALPKFSPNQIVEGKILKMVSSDTVLLAINGRELTARTQLPLKPGQTVAFRVENTHPLPTLKPVGLKLLGPDGALVSKTLAALKENIWQTMANLANKNNNADQAMFKALMQELSQGLYSKAEPSLLRTIIDKSGLSLEAKLKKGLLSKTPPDKWLPKLLSGDLKGLAARMLSQKPETAAIIEKFIGTLEDIQMLNHQGLTSEGKTLLPLPFQYDDGFFTLGQLLIQLPTDREKNTQDSLKKKDPFYRVVFMLEMSHLGPLRAEMGLKSKTVFGKLLLTTTESTQLVKKELSILAKALSEHGFKVDYLECLKKDPAIVCQPLLDEILPTDQNGYNFVA